MKLKHDENELTKPLKEDERIVEVASFIGVFRNFFKDENIETFFEYWNWCHKNGINSVSRDESENAHFLEKKDKQLAIDKYKWRELRLTNEFNDFFKYLNTELLPQYVRQVPHVYHPVAHEGKIQQTLPGEGYHLWHCEWDADYSKRVLAYALFLNDVDEGGELEFLHQGIRIKPRKGDFLIWPAYFTHLHRGNPPLDDAKWIVTGWYEDLGVNNDLIAQR